MSWPDADLARDIAKDSAYQQWLEDDPDIAAEDRDYDPLLDKGLDRDGR